MFNSFKRDQWLIYPYTVHSSDAPKNKLILMVFILKSINYYSPIHLMIYPYLALLVQLIGRFGHCGNFVTGRCPSRPTKNCIFLFGKSPIKSNFIFNHSRQYLLVMWHSWQQTCWYLHWQCTGQVIYSIQV